MKKILLIRLGSDVPLPKEMAIVNAISNDMRYPAMGTSMPGCGVVSLFYTKLSPSDIRELYRKVEEETSDTLPIVVIDLDSQDSQIGFDNYMSFDRVLKSFNEIVDEFNENNEDEEPEPEMNSVRQVKTLQLDDLLDIINTRGGIDKLTSEERARLEELTK